MTSGTTWGNRPARGASNGPETGDVRQDFNEQRLIYKCILDPSVDNSGYAGVTRVVRNGGSAKMDGSTLVIENASSVMLLTRIDISPTTAMTRWKLCGRRSKKSPRTMRPSWNAIARSSRKCSTASRWISAALPNTACPPRSCWPTSGQGRTYSPALLEKVFKGAAIGHPHQWQIPEHRRRDNFTSTRKRPVWSRRTSALEKKPDRRDPAFCKRPARFRATS